MFIAIKKIQGRRCNFKILLHFTAHLREISIKIVNHYKDQ